MSVKDWGGQWARPRARPGRWLVINYTSCPNYMGAKGDAFPHIQEFATEAEAKAEQQRLGVTAYIEPPLVLTEAMRQQMGIAPRSCPDSG